MKLSKTISAARAVILSRFFGRRIPLVASIIPTNRCNLKCPYCGRWERPGPELDGDQWVKIINELGALGCIRLSVTGGEPLLYKELGRLLDSAKSAGMHININTNGMLAYKKKELLAACDSVTVSLDGRREIHDMVRGEGTYDDALAAVRLAKDIGKSISFYTVMSKNNLGDLEHVARLAQEMGAKAFFQPGTYLDFDGLKKNPEAPDVDPYRSAIDKLVELKKSGLPVGNSLAGLAYNRRWPDDAPIKCYGGKLFIRIEPDGNIRHCGRDGIAEPNSVIGGVKAAMDRMVDPPCNSCWSAARVEFNLMAQGRVAVIWEYLFG